MYSRAAAWYVELFLFTCLVEHFLRTGCLGRTLCTTAVNAQQQFANALTEFECHRPLSVVIGMPLFKLVLV